MRRCVSAARRCRVRFTLVECLLVFLVLAPVFAVWSLAGIGGTLFLFIWVRASIGRPRYDQLMRFSWKMLLPVSIAYMLITALLVVIFL